MTEVDPLKSYRDFVNEMALGAEPEKNDGSQVTAEYVIDEQLLVPVNNIEFSIVNYNEYPEFEHSIFLRKDDQDIYGVTIRGDDSVTEYGADGSPLSENAVDAATDLVKRVRFANSLGYLSLKS